MSSCTTWSLWATLCLLCLSCPLIVIHLNLRRKEREQKKSTGGKNKKRTRSSSTRLSAKKATPAKKRAGVKKKVESESEDEEAPDTSADVALAQSLAGKRVSARNLDKTGKQFKKQAALAKIREVRLFYSKEFVCHYRMLTNQFFISFFKESGK